MSDWQQAYLRRFYDRSRGFKDGTTEFHELCAAQFPDAGRILEVGAGPTNATSTFLASLGEIHGLDPDPDVHNNEALTSASVLESDEFPYEDAFFDGCVSNYVVEHVADPRQHLLAIKRVLKPGAAYVFRTPNRFHYTSLVAAATPHWFHVRIANRLRNLPADSHDPYPTVYALNSRRAVQRHAASAGFHVEAMNMIEKEPMYGLASRLLFIPFMIYERIVNSTRLLQDCRGNIQAVLRKPA